jgi:hypothetical protein
MKMSRHSTGLEEIPGAPTGENKDSSGSKCIQITLELRLTAQQGSHLSLSMTISSQSRFYNDQFPLLLL